MIFPHTPLQQASNFLNFKEIMWQMTCNHSATSATNTINKYEDVADVSPLLQIIRNSIFLKIKTLNIRCRDGRGFYK